MATKEKATSSKSTKAKAAELLAQISGQPSPVDEEVRKTRLKTLIKLGKDRGYLTYAEVNDHLPDDVVDAEQIESIISTFSDMGIQVFDAAPDAETLLMSETAPPVPADDARPGGSHGHPRRDRPGPAVAAAVDRRARVGAQWRGFRRVG